MFSALKKKSKVLFLLTCIMSFATITHAADQTLRPITFTAKQSDVMLSSIQKPVKKKGEYVEVTLQGRLFDPVLALPLKVKDTSDRSTPEKALSLDHHANLTDNAALIVSGWMADDRPELQKMLADPEIRSRNKTGVSQITQMFLKGIVEYKGYSLALILYNDSAGPINPVITLKKTGKEWLLSNALTGDDVVNILWSVHNGHGQMNIAR